MVALLFPGQGSQFVGMGKEIYDAYPEAKRVFDEADDALGQKLSSIMFEGPEEELTKTHNAQPAILTHSIAIHSLISGKFGNGVEMGAGHSLGEFSAYVAAGTLSFADAVRTVRKRGELMFEAGQQRPGTMAAVLGMEDHLLEEVCAEASEADSVVVPANYNSPGQLVISGDVNAVLRAMEIAKQKGAKRAVQLNVSGAFHSPLMAPAAAGLEARLSDVEMNAPAFPVVSNVTTEPVSDVVNARGLLVQQLTSPVKWTGCIQTMIKHGITEFIELGPGNVLTGLMKRIDKSASAQAVGKASEVEEWLKR